VGRILHLLVRREHGETWDDDEGEMLLGKHMTEWYSGGLELLKVKARKKFTGS